MGRCSPLPACIVVLVPGLRASDLSQPDLPALSRLISEGGSGWMVCRAARVTDKRLLRSDGRESNASLLVTLGSGSRALAPLSAAPSDPPEIRFRALQTANAALDHKVPLGALGDLFHQSSRKTATLGDANAFRSDSDAWYVAMDGTGHVDLPMTRGGLLPGEQAPFGVRTDITTLLAAFDAVSPQAGLIVIECAALDRADHYAPFCLPKIATAHRFAAYRTLNTLLTALLSRCQAQNGQPTVPILLLSPAPAASSEERTDRLAPIVWWGSGEAAGTLSTASTRRPGLVLNTDVLATLADRLKLPFPPGATGRPFHSVPSASPSASALAAHDTEWMRASQLQNSPGGLPTLQLLLPLIGTLLLFAASRVASETRPRLHRLVGAIALVVITLPLGMLVLPLLHPAAPWMAEALLATLLLPFGLLATLRPQIVPLLFRLLSGLLLLLLLLDLPTGTHLLQSAWMSYSVVEGARFYGIGNEYMGVTIGAACVLFGLTGARPKPETPGSSVAPILGFAALFLALTLEMGVFGAKVGAIPSAGTAFGVTLLVWKRGRLGLKEIASIVLLAAIGLGLLAAFDARHAAGDQTHFIRALTGAGGGSLPEILLRKLQLEGWLLLHSAWSVTLLVTAAALFWIRHSLPHLFATPQSRATLLG
ncbi:MAG: hypothetical protein JWN14_1158, partial [Chthonomonadales bacterium]|nr:hypothetical protein [Chthonomonadales bacterium]